MKKQVVIIILCVSMCTLLWAGCAPDGSVGTADATPTAAVSAPAALETLQPTPAGTAAMTPAPTGTAAETAGMTPTPEGTGAAEPDPTPTGPPASAPPPTPAPEGVDKPTPRPTVSAAAQLTAAETASKGTHSYSFEAEYFSGAAGTPTGNAEMTLTFSGNSVKKSGAGDSTFYKVAENTYESTDDSGDVVTKTFTADGFTLVSWGGRFVYTRED